MSTVSELKVRMRSYDHLKECGIHVDGQTEEQKLLEARYDIGLNGHILSQIEHPSRPYDDVVGKQYVPSVSELNVRSDEDNDPIGDDAYAPVRGIVHRYPDRVLFKVSNICAVYCRYCFRREMIGAGADHLSEGDFERAIDYIRAHPQIKEVILTGGDPLILSARRLQKIMDALDGISHLDIIRIHSKIPVAFPAKIDETILSVLEGLSKALYMVVHINHAREISDAVRHAIFSIRQKNVTILSQSVLLKGVNDDPIIMEELLRVLTRIHVTPYYLHHLDRAKGTSHFRVSLSRGKKIMKMLQGRVSGISLPKYMLDIPGGYGKIPINDETVQPIGHGIYRVTDYQGGEHIYVENMEDEK